MTRKATSLFSQIITLIINAGEFRRIVRDHQGDKHSKGLHCRDQFVAMLFLHLSKVTSLREIAHGLRTVAGKIAHLGMTKVPGHSTLAYANAHRPAEMYRALFFDVLARGQSLLRGAKPFRFKNRLVSMDATFIQLCLSLFPWAQYQQTKGAVKLHMLYDHDGYFPTFAHITDGKHADAPVARTVLARPEVLPEGSIVVFDRAYVDFALFGSLMQRGVFFVTRLKEGMNWVVREQKGVPAQRGILRDDLIEFHGQKAKLLGQHVLRLVEYRDPASGECYRYLTNQLTFGPTTIARIYKDRWQIEIFFKTLKQHLKIKTFVGTSENALLIQIWTALIAVLALKLLKKLSTFGWSMSNLVSLVRLTLFSYRDLRNWLDHPFSEPPWEPDIQLPLALDG
jgi:hypothetical protein